MANAEMSGASFDFARVVSRTGQLIGRNFLPFAILAIVFAGLPYLILMQFQPRFDPADPAAFQQNMGAFAAITALSATVSVLAGLVLQAALTRASIDDLSGKPVSIGSALGTGLSALLPLIGLGILMGLGILGGMILLIVPGIMLAMRWSMATPVLVAERLGVTESMGRSAILTKGHRWAIFGLFIFYVVLVFVVQTVALLAVPGAATTMTGLSAEAPSLIALIALAAVSSLMSMIATVGIASIYFELRQIKDGVGVEEIAKVFA